MVLQKLLPGFAPVAAEFCKEAMGLTCRVASLLSKALGQPESWLEASYLQDPFVALHNLHYAPVKSQPEKGIFGLGEPLLHPHLITSRCLPGISNHYIPLQ